MEDVSIIGVDLAKKVFQLHGSASDGSVVFRKKLSRLQFAKFIKDHPRCIVAMPLSGGIHTITVSVFVCRRSPQPSSSGSENQRA